MVKQKIDNIILTDKSFINKFKMIKPHFSEEFLIEAEEAKEEPKKEENKEETKKETKEKSIDKKDKKTVGDIFGDDDKQDEESEDDISGDEKYFYIVTHIKKIHNYCENLKNASYILLTSDSKINLQVRLVLDKLQKTLNIIINNHTIYWDKMETIINLYYSLLKKISQVIVNKVED